MSLCKVLVKVRRIPKFLEKFIDLENDLVFKFNSLFVIVNKLNSLNQPYELINEFDGIRLDKSCLEVLSDSELSLIFYQSLIERELQHIYKNRQDLLEELDYMLLTRYTASMLSTLDTKLQKIYNYT